MLDEPLSPQFSAEQYLAWEASNDTKHELHHGFVFAMSGATLLHDRYAERMRTALRPLYPPPGFVFSSDVKVRVSESQFYYPDASVVCEPVDLSQTFVRAPRIVVEVLSPATRRFDRVEKRGAYRALTSLVAYLIVNPQVRSMEVDTRSGRADGWRTMVLRGDEAIYFDGERTLTLAEVYDPPLV